MKKSKLFVLLPMVALLLSGCQTEVVPSDTPSESPSEETSSEEYTPSVSYAVSITNSNEIASLTVGDSVVVAVSLITTTDGVDETISGTASEVTLSCEDPSIIGIEGLRITALNEGSTLIYATWTERGVASSSVTIEVSKEEEPPVTHEYTYGVSITNGSELSSLTEGDTKTVSVSLITYEDGVESTSVAATSADVTLSSSATDVVSVSGLELTALSKGTSNISAKWDEHNVSSNAVTVSVSEKVTEEGGDEGSSGDTEPEPEPVISYKLEITNADEIREIQTGDTRLVEVTGYTYEDDIQTDATILTSENVTLISSEPDYLSVDGLTVTAEAAKEAITLTAVSPIYGNTIAPITVTAAPEPEPEPEPEPVYTYKMTIRNAEALSNLGVGYGYETNNEVELDILLTTYLNGEYYTSYKADNTVSDLEVISYNSEVVTTNGLTVTPIEEGSTAIEVKWYNHPLNGGGEGFDDLSYFINVTVTRYEEPAPEPTPDVYITSIGFSESTYTMVYGETDPIKLDVIYEPETPTNPSWTFTSDNCSVACIEDGYLVAKGIGQTTIHVVATDYTSNDGYTAPAGTATVVVEKALNPVTSFGLTGTNIDLKVGESATIGLAAADETSNPTIVVDPYPTDADDKTFNISVDTQDEFLTISGPTDDDLNTYTITANDQASDAGAALHSYVLTIASNDINSNATRQIYVTIGTEDSVTNPVTRIGFSTGSVTLSNGGSFILGGNDVSDADVIVSVNDDAYETGWNLVRYDESLLSVTPRYDESTGAFSFVISALEPDITETVMTDLVVRSMGTPVKEAHLAVYILRAEDYTASINVSIDSVSMLTDQTLVLGEDTNYSDFSVSIYNQYNEVLEGASWDASIDTEASGIGVLNSVSRVDGADRLSITTGSNPGTGVIRVYAEDDSSIYEEINVTVSQQYYDVEQISCSLTSITLTYNEESSPKGSSTYIQDSAVTYWSSKGPVAADKEGFTLEYTGDYLSIGEDNRTITALLPTGDDGVSVTVRSTSNTSVTTTINVVVSDTTDYGVKTLSLVNCSGEDVESVTMNVSGTEDSTATLASLGVYVSISPEYASNKEYVVTSSNPSILYVDNENNITAKASKDSGNAILFVVAADSTYGASDTLEVIINTSYVKADTISVSSESLSLTTGDSYTFGVDSNISVSVTTGATDTSYTIESSDNDVISVSGSTISAVGAGNAILTFTSADGATASLTVTVTDPRTVGYNITLFFRLTSSDTNTEYSCPTYAEIYVGNNFADGSTDWTTAKLTEDKTTVSGKTYYKATFDSVLLDTALDYQILFEYAEDNVTSPTWNHKSEALTLTICGEIEDNGNAFYDAKIGDPTEIIHERNTELGQFTVTVGLKNSSSSGSNVTFAIDGDAINNWSGGEKFTTISNASYDQYYTFNWDRDADLKFFFGRYDVWWSWNFIAPGSYSPEWSESTAYCWYNEWSAPEWAFDLTSYSGKLDSYTNLLIVFTFDFSRCTSDATSFAIVSGMSVTLS